jgi:2-isopropylmalate synthase
LEICRAVRARVDTPLGIHTHDDCGFGVANALAAVAAGAVQVQGTINGYGERTGNCNLTTLIPTLQLKLDRPVVAHLAGLRELSYFVDDTANCDHNPRQPYVGANAFAHKGGMHVNAVQKLARSYEHIDPALVGNAQDILVSELSGQSNILIKAGQAGLALEKNSDAVKRVLARVKELELAGYAFEAAGASLELLIRRETGSITKHLSSWSSTAVDSGISRTSTRRCARRP